MPSAAVIHLKYADPTGRRPYRRAKKGTEEQKYVLAHFVKRGHSGAQFSFVRDAQTVLERRIEVLHGGDDAYNRYDSEGIDRLITSIDDQIRTTKPTRNPLAIVATKQDAQGVPDHKHWIAVEAVIAWYAVSGPFEIFTGTEQLVIRRERYQDTAVNWKYIFATNVDAAGLGDENGSSTLPTTTMWTPEVVETDVTETVDDKDALESLDVAPDWNEEIANSERALLDLMAMTSESVAGETFQSLF